MILQAWGGAAVLVAASLVIGYAIDRLTGRCRRAAPAVGLSVLVILAYTGIVLPGRAVTAAVLCLLACLAAAAILIVRRPAAGPEARRLARPRTELLVPVLTGGLAAAGAAVPFLANGRMGLLGVSLDNDTAAHMIWAQALADPSVKARYGLSGDYPLGPHALADTLSAGLGVRLDMAFVALAIATVVLTALCGAAALRGEAGWKRIPAGLLAALLYLVAAYYAEGSFKEPLLGLLLLGFVLTLEDVRREIPAGLRARAGALAGAAIITAGTIYVFSYPALAWLGLTVALWLAGELLLQARQVPAWARELRRRRGSVLAMVVPMILAAVLAIVLTLPTAGRVANFAGALGASPAGSGAITTSNLGNLVHELPAIEGLGIWDRTDFRFSPDNLLHAGELGALALAVLILGLGWSVSRRELVLPAAVAACAIIYWHSKGGQSPYVTAKALVVAGPLVAVAGMRGLLGSPLRPPPRGLAMARAAAAVLFVYFAGVSTAAAIRNEPVWPQASTDQLLSLDRITRNQPVLFLGASDYADWLFSHSDMSTLAPNSVSEARAVPRSNKPNTYGTPFDFDSVDPSTINDFQWFVTTRTDYASAPPPGVQLVRRTSLYELWKRVGAIPAREVIESAGTPGAILDCHAPAARALSRRRGVAAIMARPRTVPLGPIVPGGSETVTLRLPPGSWQLSLEYLSSVDLAVSVAGTSHTMPAYLDRPGPVFAVTNVASTGAPLPMTITARRPSALTGPNLAALPTELFATRLPDTRTIVPLRRACGLYVDWYQLG